MAIPGQARVFFIPDCCFKVGSKRPETFLGQIRKGFRVTPRGEEQNKLRRDMMVYVNTVRIEDILFVWVACAHPLNNVFLKYC